MITKTAASVATGVIEAFNQNDFDALREMCDPGIVYTETGTGQRMEGWAACEPGWRAWRTAMPDLTGVVLRALEDGDLAAIEIEWTGTQTGELMTPNGPIPPTGRRISIRSTQWVSVRGGHVTACDHHLDTMGILSQLGALPG